MASWEDLPEVSFVQRFHAHGDLRLPSAILPNVSLTVSWEPYSTAQDALTVLGSVGAHRDRELHSFLRHRGDVFEFSGEASPDGSLDADFRLHEAMSGQLTGEASLLDVALRPLPAVPTLQIVTARFTPTEVVPPVFPSRLVSWTGEVRADVLGYSEERYQIVETALGEWRVATQFRSEDVLTGGSRSMVQVPAPSARLELPEAACTTDVAGLVETVEKELQPLLDVLSLLSRRRVSLAEIKVYSSRKQDWAVESRRVRPPLSSPPPPRSALVAPARFDDDPSALGSVAERYSTSAHRATMRRCIPPLVEFWRLRELETLVPTAFRAIEALVNGLSSAEGCLEVTDPETLDSLLRQLRTAVKAGAPSLGLTADQRGMLYAKLGELRWAPLVPRIVQVVEQLGVQWRDLYGPASDLAAELRAAYARRSDLTHFGRIEDGEAVAYDVTRVHALTERIVSSLLEIPDEWVSAFAYEFQYWRPEQ